MSAAKFNPKKNLIEKNGSSNFIPSIVFVSDVTYHAHGILLINPQTEKRHSNIPSDKKIVAHSARKENKGKNQNPNYKGCPWIYVKVSREGLKSG